MNGHVVVDASLAVKWLVEEDDSDKAHAILQSWVDRGITRIAPYLMPFEVANALHRWVLRGELNVVDGQRTIARLLESRLELYQPPNLHVRALQIASQLKQSAAYDAHWRWRRVSTASCGPLTRGSTGRQAQPLTTCAG